MVSFDQLILQWRTMIRQTILQKRSTLQEGKGKHRRRTKQKNQNGSLTRQIIINLRIVLGKWKPPKHYWSQAPGWENHYFSLRRFSLVSSLATQAQTQASQHLVHREKGSTHASVNTNAKIKMFPFRCACIRACRRSFSTGVITSRLCFHAYEKQV